MDCPLVGKMASQILSLLASLPCLGPWSQLHLSVLRQENDKFEASLVYISRRNKAKPQIRKWSSVPLCHGGGVVYYLCVTESVLSVLKVTFTPSTDKLSL